MKIHIIVNNSSEIEITWKLPYFPNIDHEMKLIDFIGEGDFNKLKKNRDIFVVKKIVWVNETSVKAKIFVEGLNS